MTESSTITASAAGDAPASASSARPRYYAEILLVSLAGLLLEIAYTRVISFKLFYYYTYLVIGLALLGIGFGGVVVTISKRVHRATTDAVLVWSALLGALSVGVGYFIVVFTPLDTFAIWRYGKAGSFKNVALLVLICVAIFASFIAIGVIVSTLFGRHSDEIGKLYFADLFGAGLACAVVVTLLGSIGPPATIFLAGTILALVALRVAIRDRTTAVAVVAGVVAAGLAVAVIAPSVLPEPRLESSKDDLGTSDVIDSRWSPIFRVDVVQATPDIRILYHDGLIGSAIYRWDGTTADLERFKFDTNDRSLPFAVLGEPPSNELIIGAAGGHEILASKHFGADQIDAIELNPVTHDLVTNTYKDWDGDVGHAEGVNYVRGDGRSFLARSDDTYDLVWFPAPDSYSATNAATSGAFVLSESYLYTADAIQDSLEHLSDNGVLAAQFGELDFAKKPNRTSRYVATARKALTDLGVEDPSQHILVATSPTDLGAASYSTILVKKTPFTPEEIARFTEQLAGIEGAQLVYAPGEEVPPRPVAAIAATGNPGDYDYDVSAITDNGPFFWHFTTFPTVLSDYTQSITTTDREDTVGERVLVLLLIVSLFLAAVFLLLPFVAIRDEWRRLPRKGMSAVYFCSLGLGFLFFEITLIQKLTLFLGYPTYSLTVTLMSILIFTGIGALMSGRIATPTGRTLGVLWGALAVLTAFYLFGLTPLTNALFDLPLLARALVAFVVLAPLGLCLGMFMPLGLGAVSRLSDFPREYVAWGWAVNGFASVVGAVLTTILAMTFGFNVVLVLALLVYAIAVGTLRVLLRGEPVSLPT